MQLSGADRNVVSEAVLVRGRAVEDPRLAQSAVDTAKWFDRRVAMVMYMWCGLTPFCVGAALWLHNDFLWIFAGCGIVMICLATITRKRYRRAIRENSPLTMH